MFTQRQKIIIFSLLVLYNLFFFSVLEAENKSFTVCGFTANIPHQFLGLNIYGVNYEKNNFYLDFKFTLPAISLSNDFYKNISINKAQNIYHDHLITEKDDWVSFDFGITKQLKQKYVIYLAGGFTMYRLFKQYKDDFEILGKNGEYWVEDEGKSKTYPNFIVGMLLFFKEDLIGQIGFQAVPKGIAFSIGHVIKEK